MYVEERIYTLQVGKVPEFLKLYESEGLAIQTGHLPNLVGFYITEVGPLNVVVHMWGYDDLNQRDKCRAALQADPAWQTYVVKARQFYVSQETRILKCAPFFAERLKRMLAAAVPT